MAAFDFSASSLFRSRISEPVTFISSKPPSMLNFKKTPLIKISCDYSCLEVKDVHYQPPGTQINLLNGVSFSLQEKSFGLIFGQSGSGKTTLLQLLAGLSKPTSGSIHIQKTMIRFLFA